MMRAVMRGDAMQALRWRRVRLVMDDEQARIDRDAERHEAMDWHRANIAIWTDRTLRTLFSPFRPGRLRDRPARRPGPPRLDNPAPTLYSPARTGASPCWLSPSSSVSSSSSASSISSSSVGLTDPELIEPSPRPGAALVTGGGRRIGRAIALRLAQAGFDVAVHHRGSADAAEAVSAEIRAQGRHACVVQADLTQEAEVRALVPAAVAVLGPLCVLVNNASAFEDDRVGDLSRATWDRHLETNVRAPIVLAEAFAEQAPDGPPGSLAIVNLLDQRVLKPDPRFFSYALSRNALWWATRTLAQALAPRVRVNGVGPGPTLPSIHQTQAQFAAEAAAVPLARPGDPEAVAEAVAWLVDAALVTGQMIAVDGGQHLAWMTPDILAAEDE